MSKRRTAGKVVEINDDDGAGPYLVRIVASAGDVQWDECVLCDLCDDRECREWRKLNVLDNAGQATQSSSTTLLSAL